MESNRHLGHRPAWYHRWQRGSRAEHRHLGDHRSEAMTRSAQLLLKTALEDGVALRMLDIEKFCDAFLPGMDDARKSGAAVSPLFANLHGLCLRRSSPSARATPCSTTRCSCMGGGGQSCRARHLSRRAHGFTLLPGNQAGQSLQRQLASSTGRRHNPSRKAAKTPSFWVPRQSSSVKPKPRNRTNGETS